MGAIALEVHNRALDRHAAAQALSAEARQAVIGAHGKFATELPALQGEDRSIAEAIVKQSLGDSIRLVMWLAAALALAASICAALTIRPQGRRAAQALRTAEAG